LLLLGVAHLLAHTKREAKQAIKKAAVGEGHNLTAEKKIS